ncbi:MAG: DMT family transporter [Planctomycetales bacterium]
MPYVLFLLICSIWGSSFILMKKAVVCFSPASVGLVRVAGGALVLGWMWWRQSRPWPFGWRDAGPLLVVVLLGFAWPFTMQPYLVAREGSAFVGLSVGFTPLLTIIASIPLLGVYPTPRQLVGVLGALVCMGLLMVDSWQREIPIPHLLLAVTVPLGYALTNTTIRRSLLHLPVLELTGLSQLLAIMVLLPIAALGPTVVDAKAEDFPRALYALAFLGVIGTGLASLWFNQLIRDHGPLFAGMVTNLVPVGALLWGWADRERISPAQVGALTGLLAMVSLVQYGAAVRPAPGETPAEPARAHEET